jgi:tryptophanyl-tRNA synthetase
MAADILLYKSTHVPVGADQKQHLELCRDIAQKFNSDYKKDLFPVPEPLIQENISRVMSLRDGTVKMSKSDESNYSRIDLKDSADEIIKKIKKAKSDSSVIPDNLKDLKNKPEALNLITIYSSLSDRSLDQVLSEVMGKEYSYLKNKLSEALVEVICPVGKEIKKLLNDKSFLEKTLKEGTEKARTIAELNLKEIKNVVGFF